MTPLFLIADDSVPKAFFLKSLIKKSGFPAELLLAKNTEEAKALIDKHPDISFAFIDYEMPTENGPAVIKYLKEKNPNARIALVTAYGIDKYHQDGTAAGAEEFVCTTWAEDDVARKINEILSSWRILEHA